MCGPPMRPATKATPRNNRIRSAALHDRRIAAAGICVFFKHAPLPTAGYGRLAVGRFRVCWKKIPLLSGRKKSDAAVFCDNRLENIRCFSDLRDEMLRSVEIAAELTAE